MRRRNHNGGLSETYAYNFNIVRTIRMRCFISFSFIPPCNAPHSSYHCDGPSIPKNQETLYQEVVGPAVSESAFSEPEEIRVGYAAETGAGPDANKQTNATVDNPISS
ncbi:hypothetical protein Naga_100433g1 [Nannochloropsis gaditana]|uniref:Uncharacterized protein n=1 Tax=Nannochloropsis gaditana TaxID=72520 RepID=W7TID3_9STRA|nr:hypothetical protein Naga_100433g1 [Nannochloropsis gaditana]